MLTPSNRLKLPKSFSCEVLVKYLKSSLRINLTVLQNTDPQSVQSSQNWRHVVLFIDWFTNLTSNIRGCTTLVINNSSWNSVPQAWGQCAPSLMLFLEPGSSNWWNFYREYSSFRGCQSFMFFWGGEVYIIRSSIGWRARQKHGNAVWWFLGWIFPMG